MISSHQNREIGQQVDQFLECPRKEPVSLRNFDYLECTDCHDFIDLHARFVDASAWKFSLMGLIPGLLKCAKGVCPRCQDMRKTFKGLLETIESGDSCNR